MRLIVPIACVLLLFPSFVFLRRELILRMHLLRNISVSP